MYFIFLPHLTYASALPGDQETQKFSLKYCMLITKNNMIHIKISPGYS